MVDKKVLEAVSNIIQSNINAADINAAKIKDILQKLNNLDKFVKKLAQEAAFVKVNKKEKNSVHTHLANVIRDLTLIEYNFVK